VSTPPRVGWIFFKPRDQLKFNPPLLVLPPFCLFWRFTLLLPNFVLLCTVLAGRFPFAVNKDFPACPLWSVPPSVSHDKCWRIFWLRKSRKSDIVFSFPNFFFFPFPLPLPPILSLFPHHGFPFFILCPVQRSQRPPAPLDDGVFLIPCHPNAALPSFRIFFPMIVPSFRDWPRFRQAPSGPSGPRETSMPLIRNLAQPKAKGCPPSGHLSTSVIFLLKPTRRFLFNPL